MAVPNETIFGVDEKRNSVNYGLVRSIQDENKLINFLRYRIEVFFIDQVLPLEKVSPFPLSVLTCVGIETLGEITLPENNDDTSAQFVGIVSKFDKSFSRQLSKEDKKYIQINWQDKDASKIKSIAALIYKYYRNTMIHGYRGRGVFLSSQLAEPFRFENGFLILNPDWFWNRFKELFFSTFEQLILDEKKGSGSRTRCLKYVEQLLA